MLQTSRGFMLEGDPEDAFISRTIQRTGTWEEAVAQAIERYIEPGWFFLDLGANIGYFSVLAALRHAHVIAVEADPRLAEILVRNAALNRVEIETHPVAISTVPGVAYLHRSDIGNPGAAYLVTDRIDEDDMPIAVGTLAEVLGRRRPQFVKIDIEGLEYPVLAGSRWLLDEARVLVIEVSPRQYARFGARVADLLALLRESGFDVALADGASLDALDGLPDGGYANIIAVRDLPLPVPAPLPPSIFVRSIVWRDVHAMHDASMVGLALELGRRGRTFRIGAKVGDADVARARSQVASMFLRAEPQMDVLLTIDSDIEFLPADAIKLAEAAVQYGIVGAAYAKRGDVAELAVQLLDGQDVPFMLDAKPVEVRYVSGGFMAIHRRVLEAIAETLPVIDEPSPEPWRPFYQQFTVPHPRLGQHWMSEDWSIVERARALGFPPYIDPSIRLIHHGDYGYTLEDMLRTPRPAPGPLVVRQDDGVQRAWRGAPPEQPLKSGARVSADRILDTLAEDIAAFSEITVEEIEIAVPQGAAALAGFWESRPTDESEAQWYERVDVGSAYILDLTAWHRASGGVPPALAASLGGKDVLDYGAGIGTAALRAAAAGARVVALEVNPVMRRLIRFRAERLGLRVDVPEPDAFPSAPAMFDVAICWHVFEHLEDPCAALESIRTMLRPGGLFLTQSDWHQDDVHPMHHVRTDWPQRLADAGFVSPDIYALAR